MRSITEWHRQKDMEPETWREMEAESYGGVAGKSQQMSAAEQSQARAAVPFLWVSHGAPGPAKSSSL